ncbi:hypothetical protein FACS1894216_04560 [Synergistales bacterium]|nr:hypothetical protein FACS1894216_04560 [Synergistales bacterium]
MANLRKTIMANPRKTILAVDDTTASLNVICAALGYEFIVCLAKSGSMAMSILNNRQIDLILLDIEMPEMSGFDFIDIVKQKQVSENIRTPLPPVIFVTSHATEEFVIKAIQMGGKDYIVKPFASEVLRNRVHNVFRSAEI